MDDSRNILGLQETIYMSDFKGKYVPKTDPINKILDRLKLESEKDCSSVKAAPKPRQYWMRLDMIKMKLCNMPKFNHFQHEPKDIVKRPPVLNFQSSTDGTGALLEKHNEIIRTRPKYPAVPCGPLLDDTDDPEGRNTFVEYTYSMDKIPEAKPKNVQLYGEQVKVPANNFSNQKFTGVQRQYPPIKPSLKCILRQHERIQERNYDNFDIDFMRKSTRKRKENFHADISERDDIAKVHDEDLTSLKYRNYTLGYTGHITDKPMDLKSKRKLTVDPMLSFSKAIDSRYDKHDCRTSVELVDMIKKKDLNDRRIDMGIIHLPVDSYYHPCITNKPYHRRGESLVGYNKQFLNK